MDKLVNNTQFKQFQIKYSIGTNLLERLLRLYFQTDKKFDDFIICDKGAYKLNEYQKLIDILECCLNILLINMLKIWTSKLKHVKMWPNIQLYIYKQNHM